VRGLLPSQPAAAAAAADVRADRARWARDSRVLGLVAISWWLIGPVHKLLQALLVTGYTDVLVLRLLAEFGVVGILALWIASLIAVRRSEKVAKATV
jgi:hypothetical protein